MLMRIANLPPRRAAGPPFARCPVGRAAQTGPAWALCMLRAHCVPDAGITESCLAEKVPALPGACRQFAPAAVSARHSQRPRGCRADSRERGRREPTLRPCESARTGAGPLAHSTRPPGARARRACSGPQSSGVGARAARAMALARMAASHHLRSTRGAQPGRWVGTYRTRRALLRRVLSKCYRNWLLAG